MIEKVTSPLYRAPEIVDKFVKSPINQKIDVWALGCVMYALMYHKLPFQEDSKLNIMNGTYRVPE